MFDGFWQLVVEQNVGLIGILTIERFKVLMILNIKLLLFVSDDHQTGGEGP